MPRATQLGRYQLLDRIAFGGMAEIYRAKTFDQRGQAHMVAVKRVLAHLTDDDDFVKMLIDEAKVSATLRHANIARLYEFVQSDEAYFLAMEWVDGKDVRAILERHRLTRAPIPVEHVAWVILEAASGLAAAHAQKDSDGSGLQIVHRDVSPSNLLCAYSGEVKLCDFGIAKATTTRVQTRTGVIKGKVKYMSPEQALGRKLDSRSDLFSLGSVAYEMLTLRAPFVARTEVELIFAVRDAKRPAIHELADVPEELERIVDRLMSRSRSQRFQSGDEVAAALRTFLDDYRQGYLRSHISRFMRPQFAEEIEPEHRVLEDYVLEEADAQNVGTNLIADALGGDAPYKRFFASATMREKARAQKGDSKRNAKPPADAALHVEATRIFDAAELQARSARGRSVPDANESTRLFGRDIPKPSSGKKRGASALPEPPARAPLPALHEERTRLFDHDDDELLLDESDILTEDVDHSSHRKRR